MTRDEMLDALIANDLDTNEQVQSTTEMVTALLRYGCKGYANMSDEELAKEYADRFGD